MSGTLLLPAVASGMPQINTVYCCDALTFLRAIPDKSIDLIATDPPYNGVKDEAWDNQWKSDQDYIEWLNNLCIEWKRILKANGSLYVFASPRLAAQVEVLISNHLSILNSIRWKKEEGWHNKTKKDELRSYLQPWEAIIFAEQHNSDNFARGESSYAGAIDDLRGFVFEPIRDYLESERQRAGISFDQVRQIVGCAPGSGLPSHWFTRSQWILPTFEQYSKLQKGFNSKNGGFLRREYEDLRREYEGLRRPFNVSAQVPYTDVWTYPTVNTYPGKHPCEKPLAMMQHIVNASSRPDAIILDCFGGSGTTFDAARREGRRYIGCDADPHWVKYAQRRLSHPFTLPMFDLLENVG